MSAIDPTKASQSNSTNAFITALVVNTVLVGVEVAAFVVLKSKLWRIYMPRSHLPPPDKRAEELPGGVWRWVPALLRSPTVDIVHQNGLDAYMFLRFIKLLCIIFAVFTVATFLVIIPVDAAGVDSVLEGVEKISWSNIISPQDQHRFAAHVVVVYLLTAFALYMIYRELNYFLEIRQKFLTSKEHTKTAQSRTVLVTAIPDELSTEQDLRTFASFVPGGVDKIWMYRSTKGLNDLFDRRQDACEKLEAAASKVLTQATMAWKKRVKMHKKMQKHKVKDEEKPSGGFELVKPEPSLQFLNELVPEHKRPKHKTKMMGILGKKVDTIDWCKLEISTLNDQIKAKRAEHEEGKFLGSAFIRCNLQMGAHILTQCLSYHQPMKMYQKWMEAHPKDIVWNNLDDGALEMKSRYVLSWLATFGLIIAWSFPVTFIGTISNLSELCVDVSWLAWVCRAPRLVQGIIEGVLPPALLAGLFAILPFILKFLAWYECIPRWSLISVSVYRRFYFFLLVHGFLVVTFVSGLVDAIGEIIQEPTKAVTKLASRLPSASVFFLTYMLTQGLAGAATALVQLAPLVFYYIKKWLLGRTPREAYEVTFMMPSADFGVVLPRLSLLATITFAYSVMSPLINLLALISFGLFYLAWKFLLVQVFDQKQEQETGGMYFPMAVNNLFFGLYIEHICLACLFFMRAVDEGPAAVVKGAFMIVAAVLTAFVHIFINNAFSPLYQFLPMSLATKKLAKKFEKERKRKSMMSNAQKEDSDEGMDLFSAKSIKGIRKRIKKTVDKTLMSDDHIELDVLMKKPAAPPREEKDVTMANAPVDPATSGQLSQEDSDKMSLKSNNSKASSKKSRISFDAAAPRVSHADDSDSDDEEVGDDHAFDHPSTYKEQPWIWIPKDELGLSGILAAELRAASVGASDVGATMDANGIVEVRRNPPDEEWTGGHDA